MEGQYGRNPTGKHHYFAKVNKTRLKKEEKRNAQDVSCLKSVKPQIKSKSYKEV